MEIVDKILYSDFNNRVWLDRFSSNFNTIKTLPAIVASKQLWKWDVFHLIMKISYFWKLDKARTFSTLAIECHRARITVSKSNYNFQKMNFVLIFCSLLPITRKPFMALTGDKAIFVQIENLSFYASEMQNYSSYLPVRKDYSRKHDSKLILYSKR